MEEDDSDRKTLRDQMLEAEQLKEIEYRNSLQARNSSYKLDEKSLQFYNQLKQEEQEREQKIKEREAHELDKFKLKKQLVGKSTVSKESSKVKKLKVPRHKLKQKLVKVLPTEEVIVKEEGVEISEEGSEAGFHRESREQISGETGESISVESPGDHHKKIPILQGYSSDSE